MKRTVAAIAMALALVGSTSLFAQGASDFARIPPKKDDDLKLYLSDGGHVKGKDAMARMQKEADVVLWLAGNQFFAMDDVVAAYRKESPGTRVGLITLPPGLLLDAIAKGGWIYEGETYPGRPDVYGSVNIGHLQSLKAKGLMDSYMVYMHNEMQLMVAKGNPKGIKGISDLARSDIRTSMPNPVNEGIMQFYGRKVLERHGLWTSISANKECLSCQTTDRNWFTAVHHRETPDRIKTGQSDTGFVWRTEVLEALREGAPIEGVELPAVDSLRDEVSYVIGALANSTRKGAAVSYLKFIATAGGQDAYARSGFVKANPTELESRPIP